MNRKLLIILIVVVVLVAGFLVWWFLQNQQNEVKPKSVEDIIANQSLEDLLVGEEARVWKYENGADSSTLELLKQGNGATVDDFISNLLASRFKGTWKFVSDSKGQHLVVDGEVTEGSNVGQKAKLVFSCIEVVRQEEFAKEFSAVLSVDTPSCDGERTTYRPF